MISTTRTDIRNIPVSLVANGTSVRTVTSWASGNGYGQAAARKWAENHGQSAILWNDGHVTVFLLNNDHSELELHRVRIYPN